jgi:hypothetical protein
MEARHVTYQINLDDVRIKNLKEFFEMYKELIDCASTEVFVVVNVQKIDNATDTTPTDIKA